MSILDWFRKKRHGFTDQDREFSELTRQLKSQVRLKQQQVKMQELRNTLKDLQSFDDPNEGSESDPGSPFDGMLQQLLMSKLMPGMATQQQQQVQEQPRMLSDQQIELFGKQIIVRIPNKAKDAIRDNLVNVSDGDWLQVKRYLAKNL